MYQRLRVGKESKSNAYYKIKLTQECEEALEGSSLLKISLSDYKSVS